jgi:hypothetical protein
MWAHSRIPIEVMVSGWAMSLRQASQAASTVAACVCRPKKEGEDGKVAQVVSIAAIDLGANGLPSSLRWPAAASAALI